MRRERRTTSLFLLDGRSLCAVLAGVAFGVTGRATASSDRPERQSVDGTRSWVGLRASAAPISLNISSSSAAGSWFSLLAIRRSKQVPEGSCTCDCCLSSRTKEAQSAVSTASRIVCSPRSGQATSADSNGGCTSLCTAPPSVSAELQSLTDQVDYWRYCPSYCSHVNNEISVVCVPVATANKAWDDADAAAEAADTAAAIAAAGGTPLESGFAPAPSTQPLSAPAPALAAPPPINVAALGFEPALSDLLVQATASGGSEVRIAKALTARARDHAVLAGEAARRARLAYEAIFTASQDAAVAVGKATLDGLVREARVQASQAAAARLQFETAAKSTALQAAANASAVYQTASLRDQQSASTWEMQSEQLGAAASDSERAAKQAQQNAVVKRTQGTVGWRWQALRSSGQARRAEAEGIEFQRRAAAAKVQAESLRDQQPWYDKAEQAAAQYALQKALPPGVAAPPLPAQTSSWPWR